VLSNGRQWPHHILFKFSEILQKFVCVFGGQREKKREKKGKLPSTHSMCDENSSCKALRENVPLYEFSSIKKEEGSSYVSS
jgi:hypothetical protein